MAAIPQQLNYASGALNSLPEGTNSQTMVVVPSNGSKFDSDGAIITFDLPSRGYLQPSTMYLRYQATIVSTTTALEIVGTPAYTPFVNSTVLQAGWLQKQTLDQASKPIKKWSHNKKDRFHKMPPVLAVVASYRMVSLRNF